MYFTALSTDISLSLSLFILPSSSSSSLLLLLLPPTQVICFRSNLIEKIEGIEHLASTLQSLELNDNRVQSLRGVGGNTALEYVNRLNRVLDLLELLEYTYLWQCVYRVYRVYCCNG